MKKYILLLTIAITFFSFGQKKKIDFRTTDAKGLTRDELIEYNRSRQEFFSALKKSAGLRSEVKSVVIQGNKIKTIIYNYGSISAPGVTGNVLDLVWQGIGYGYEFGPLVGAKVPRANSPVDSLKIVSEGFGTVADGEFGPDGLKWGWLPKAGYSDPNQNDIATWGARSKVQNDLRLKPPSWPESWYNAGLGQYVYPSFLGGNSTVPDEEVYYVVDDYTKKEFEYYPFPNDSLKRGLGMNLEVRTFQFSNPLAEDIMFLVYSAENSSPKTLPEVYFGMFGDPHVGGPSNFSDDAASFIPAREGIIFKDGQDLAYVNGVLTSQRSRNLVFAWDPDNKSDLANFIPGYFGYKFLESPNNSLDGIDNDDDGIIDENPFNDKGTYIDGVNTSVFTGISDTVKYKSVYGNPKPRWSGDENGNWDPTRDDIGVDGILNPNAPDFGEGNGVPDQLVAPDGTWLGSEPNFGFRDVNESDQMGLKSFWALTWGGTNRPKNDLLMYDKISSEMDTAGVALLYPPITGDNIFLYGSGPFKLNQGDRQRFSIALLMGSNLPDLLLNSEISQRVLEASYRFAQPPPKPRVTAVAGNGKVTLYWDRSSENGIDPLTNLNDFEGYKIYRSRDFTFSDVYKITDGSGNPFIGEALYDGAARKRAQWHKPWTIQQQELYKNGFHPAEYEGRAIKYYMGEPLDQSGLVHQYVDSTVTNGITYYYAVVAFDHGVYNDSLKLPPTETQATIQRDAVTQEFRFDVNTVAVVPNALASGIIDPSKSITAASNIVHSKGDATGPVTLQVLNQQALGSNSYQMTFKKIKVGNDSVFAYTVFRQTPVVEHVMGNETLFVSLKNIDLIKSSLRVHNGPDTLSASIDTSQIVIDSASGQIRAKSLGLMKKGQRYTVQYQYYPIINSSYTKNQDANVVFDGVRPFVLDEALAIDSLGSYFLPSRPTGIQARVIGPIVGQVRLAPLDIRLEFQQSTNDTSLTTGHYIAPVDSFGTNNPNNKTVRSPFKVINATNNIPLQVLSQDNSPTGKVGRWDPGEIITIITPPPYQAIPTNSMMSINIFRQNSTSNIHISAGTSFTARMKKPFNQNDEYTFTTKPISYDAQLASASLDKVIVVPNPYVVTSQFELPSNRPDLRAERAIQFRNLPRECTIRIYTVTGELVQTIQKNDNTNYYNWDVLSSESARIAYGIYIYHIETPNGGTKIGRLGIIK